MLYRKFNLIHQELKNGNFELAENLLCETIGEAKTKSARELHDKLSSLVRQNNGKADEPKVGFQKLDQFDSRKILPGISIVTCCMNRNENLLKALKTWVKLAVNEIIIVDWSSTPEVTETIAEVKDERVKVLRVDGEQRWILTYGFNVGLRFASYSKVYKFDADIQVEKDFLERNTFKSNQFVRGYWKEAFDRGDETQAFINGSFGCDKKALKSVAYYNELIRTYGWDDSDLYERLAAQGGLGTKYLDFHSLKHMEQEEEERTVNQDVNNDLFIGEIKPTDFNNYRNKFVGRTTDFWTTQRLQNYDVTQQSKNVWVLNRNTHDASIPSYLIDNANIYAATHFLWNRQSKLIAKSEAYDDFAQLIFLEYQSNINFVRTLELLGECDSSPEVVTYTTEDSNYSEFIESAVMLANKRSTKTLAVAIGESYQHKSIFNYGNVVECIILPAKLFKVVKHFWFLNNWSKNIQDELLKPVTINDFNKAYLENCKPVLYVDAQHGLGNRIRAIGSAAAIAKAANRELVIVWESDHHCECKFSDLFEYSGKVFDKSLINLAAMHIDVFNYMEIEQGAHKDKPIVLNDTKDVYLRAAYTFKHQDSHWQSENEFIQRLKPTAEIQALIDQVDVENCLAAHVRMEAGKGLDHNTYDSVENWTQEGHDELHFWRDKSHFSNFIKRIDALIEENNDLKIFLATDLEENYKIFENYYGGRLIYLRRDLYDRSKEQIKYGLADAILLSKSKKLLGSTWSSFSELAMRLSETYSSIEMSGKDF